MLLRINGLHDNDPNCNFEELFVRPKKAYNKMYLCDPNEYTRLDGFDNSIFLTTDNEVYRVLAWIDDTLHATKIYTIPGKEKILSMKPLYDSLTLYLSDYSIIVIHYESFQFQTYARISARVFN